MCFEEKLNLIVVNEQRMYLKICKQFSTKEVNRSCRKEFLWHQKLSDETNYHPVSTLKIKIVPHFHKFNRCFTHLQSFLEDFLGLGTTDSAVDSYFFVTTDTERTNGISGLGVDGLLSGELFQHLKR